MSNNPRYHRQDHTLYVSPAEVDHMLHALDCIDSDLMEHLTLKIQLLQIKAVVKQEEINNA